MKIHTFPQYSEEYWTVKKGKMSASHAQEIGNIGKGLDTYIHTLMSEYFELTPEEKYTNEFMELGLKLEETAIVMYETDNDVKVERIGFVEIDDHLGCSPDGFVGKDGIIEIKCKKNVNHFRNVLYGANEIESKYVWQMQMQLLLTGRKWCDYIAYSPNFEKDIIVIREEIDSEKQEKLKIGIEKGKKMIEDIKKLYLSKIN